MKYYCLLFVLLPVLVSAKSDTTIIKTDRGDVIEIYQPDSQTAVYTNPQTGEKRYRKYKSQKIPLTINGQTIYPNTTNSFILKAANAKITEVVLAVFESIKDSLVSGSYSYNLPDIVIGSDGKVAYYSHDALRSYPSTHENHIQNGSFTESQKIAYEKKFDSALQELEFMPLVVDGEKVPFRLDITTDLRVNQ